MGSRTVEYISATPLVSEAGFDSLRVGLFNVWSYCVDQFVELWYALRDSSEIVNKSEDSDAH
jgi:hypothetical protein